MSSSAIAKLAIANVAVALFLERAIATFDLTAQFVLPRGHFPQIPTPSLSPPCIAVGRRALPRRSLHTLDAAPDPDLDAAPTPTSTPPSAAHPSPDLDLDAACPSLAAGTRGEHASSFPSPISA